MDHNITSALPQEKVRHINEIMFAIACLLYRAGKGAPFLFFRRAILQISILQGYRPRAIHLKEDMSVSRVIQRIWQQKAIPRRRSELRRRISDSLSSAVHAIPTTRRRCRPVCRCGTSARSDGCQLLLIDADILPLLIRSALHHNFECLGTSRTTFPNIYPHFTHEYFSSMFPVSILLNAFSSVPPFLISLSSHTKSAGILIRAHPSRCLSTFKFQPTVPNGPTSTR